MAAVGEYELAAQSRYVVCQIGDNPIHTLERHYYKYAKYGLLPRNYCIFGATASSGYRMPKGLL